MSTKKNDQCIENKDSKPDIFVAAVGASAGGLEALKTLFSSMPQNTGIAFVLVTHQKPGSTSLLPELLQEVTSIPIQVATDGLKIQADNIYVNPSSHEISLKNGAFVLSPPKEDNHITNNTTDWRYHPINLFFDCLAHEFSFRAIGIILSGTCSDGTMGVQSIKQRDGLVIVEDPAKAGFASMPSNAIATGVVDLILPTENMADALVKYTTTLQKKVNMEQLKNSRIPEESLEKIFVLLRNQTGHDFSSYKINTLHRRVERRMTIHQMSDPEAYISFLNKNPQEVELLFKELLIRVTSFYRDPLLWEALSSHQLQQLILSHGSEAPIRVWVPGCATGEEAYSLAIALCEIMEAEKKFQEVQIFATDIDKSAIDIARKGKYPEVIAEDISYTLLSKYFYKNNGHYIVRKDIREMIIFATQNLIKDPPFTRMDLISCRNLLIYMRADLQNKLFPLFHYALNPQGVLVLGPSESIGNYSTLFEPSDKYHKIFKRKDSPHGVFSKDNTTRLSITDFSRNTCKDNNTKINRDDRTFTISVLKMLVTRFAPICIVTNYAGDIYYIHGQTGAYLQLTEGRPRNNLLEMAREGLHLSLSRAFQEIAGEDYQVIRGTSKVKSESDFISANYTVERIQSPETLRGLVLVTLSLAKASVPENKISTTVETVHDEEDDTLKIDTLKRELKIARESYQTIVEELESSNEELKSTNEELQSTNEELQSTNEELETSKEEMQSLNTELSTVNSELHAKLDDLSKANDDMQNLLNSTDIATVFLDDNLCINRFTEQAIQIFSLRTGDIGRPINELSSNLSYSQLLDDAHLVLKTLIPIHKEVKTKSGHWYNMKLLPYRTTENVISGLVCTFIDINETKQAESQTAFINEVLEQLPEALLILDQQQQIQLANKAFLDLFGLEMQDPKTLKISEIAKGALWSKELKQAMLDLGKHNQPFEGVSIAIQSSRNEQQKIRVSGKMLNPLNTTQAFSLITLALENHVI